MCVRKPATLDIYTYTKCLCKEPMPQAHYDLQVAQAIKKDYVRIYRIYKYRTTHTHTRLMTMMMMMMMMMRMSKPP
jgi:hypothetical protein